MSGLPATLDYPRPRQRWHSCELPRRVAKGGNRVIPRRAPSDRRQSARLDLEPHVLRSERKKLRWIPGNSRQPVSVVTCSKCERRESDWRRAAYSGPATNARKQQRNRVRLASQGCLRQRSGSVRQRRSVGRAPPDRLAMHGPRTAGQPDQADQSETHRVSLQSFHLAGTHSLDRHGNVRPFFARGTHVACPKRALRQPDSYLTG